MAPALRPAPHDLATRAARRAGRRLIWFLVLLYLLNNIDRTNIGFAALTMNPAIGLSTESFGVAVGAFYLGYLLFEIPSNVLLARQGARLSLARMAISSGLVTMLTAFVQGPVSFYVLRLALGVAEAGYLVGIVLYLSYWFPAAARARSNALFMLALPLAFALSSATAGSILDLDGWLGLAGWQYLFLLEGAPAVAVGFVALFYLRDHPADAAWLPAEERAALVAQLAAETPQAPAGAPLALWRQAAGLLRDPVVPVCGLVYMALNFGLITLTSWMPQFLRMLGLPVGRVGYVALVAPLVASVAMFLWGRVSDRRNERVFNTAGALFVGAAGWGLVAMGAGLAASLAGFVLAAIGIYATYALSFAIPQTYVALPSRPVAIALIGVIGNVGGIFVPIIIGHIKQRSGSFSPGFLVVALVMALAGAATLHLGIKLRRQPRPTHRANITQET